MAQLFLWFISAGGCCAIKTADASRKHLFMLITAADRTPLLASMAGKPDALTRQIVSSVQQRENSNRFICNNLSRETVCYTSRRGAMPPRYRRQREA